jgi:pyrroline-5-carboxylate reductase
MRIAVLGVGKMGESLIRGWLRSGEYKPEAFAGSVRHPERAECLSRELGVRVVTDNAEAVQGADAIVVAVKPQKVEQALAECRLTSPAGLVVSIAAGVTLRHLASCLPPGTAVVRAMPNTPVLICSGMTVLTPGPSATAQHLETARSLFEAVGRVAVLDEQHMNIVTGLSASGPAFLYVIIEAFAEGGVMAGLPRQKATELTAQMCLGAARMVLETGEHPAALKDGVTTPAGCTITGLLALEDGRIRSTIARAVVQTSERAADLDTLPR